MLYIVYICNQTYLQLSCILGYDYKRLGSEDYDLKDMHADAYIDPNQIDEVEELIDVRYNPC